MHSVLPPALENWPFPSFLPLFPKPLRSWSSDWTALHTPVCLCSVLCACHLCEMHEYGWCMKCDVCWMSFLPPRSSFCCQLDHDATTFTQLIRLVSLLTTLTGSHIGTIFHHSSSGTNLLAYHCHSIIDWCFVAAAETPLFLLLSWGRSIDSFFTFCLLRISIHLR